MELLLTTNEASQWASGYLGKNVTPSNISYLIQYGRIQKVKDNGTFKIKKEELLEYYNSNNFKRDIEWKEKLGNDLNWALSFDYLKEADTTKHVHRLHPYKGKFIPQLVEYFLDDHIDEFKKEAYFQKEDIILDPFCGSGTTLIQANELGMHAVGIDISVFNSLISNCKIRKYNTIELNAQIIKVTESLKNYLALTNILQFEYKLINELYEFNNIYFPVPEFKYNVKQNLIDGDKYGAEKAKEFLPIFIKLIDDYNIKLFFIKFV